MKKEKFPAKKVLKKAIIRAEEQGYKYVPDFMGLTVKNITLPECWEDEYETIDEVPVTYDATAHRNQKDEVYYDCYIVWGDLKKFIKT